MVTHKFEELQFLTKQNCTELIIDFVTYVPFRIIQVFQTSLSIFSIPLLLFVIRRYIYCSTFHLNIKIIFILYYCVATGHATINATMQIYQTVRSMLPDSCKAFPTRVEYETFNLCLASMTIGLVAIQLAIFLERTMATLHVNNYEKHGVMFAALFSVLAVNMVIFVAIIVVHKLIFFTALIYICLFYYQFFLGRMKLLLILVVLTIMYITYRHDDFDELTASMLNTPSSAGSRINRMFIILGGISVFVIIGMQTLLQINKRNHGRSPKSLSSRYQTLENMFITKFSTYLSLLQVAIYVSFSLGGLGMRSARYVLFGDDEIAFGAARGIFYLIPLFTFLLPLLTIYLLRKYRSQRNAFMNSVITMKSTGLDGVQNYHDVISKAWA